MVKKVFDQTFVQKQKEILLAEKARVSEELKSINKFPRYGDSDEANAQEIERFEEYKGMEKKLFKFRDEVNNALKLIDKDKYGLCEVCGKPIDKDRLQAFPAALTCTNCHKK